MRRLLRCAAISVLTAFLCTGCFSYKDMNRLLFYTMGVGDVKDGEFLFYGEAFKAYRGEGDKAGEEKRIILFGKGDSLTHAVKDMRNSANYPIEYAGNKAFIISKALAEVGVGNILDIFDRDQKPSLRIYLMVYDGDVQELMNTTMEDEHFMGLYLYELMNSQRNSLGIVVNQYYEFLENMKVGSSVNVVPLMRLTTIKKESEGESAEGGEKGGGKGGSPQSLTGSNPAEGGDQGATNQQKPAEQKYILFDGAAVFLDDKMKTTLSLEELEAYNLITSPMQGGLINAQNPSKEGKRVGFTILKNKYHHKIAVEDGRIKLRYKLDLRAVLLEAQEGIGADEEMVEQLKANLSQVVKDRITQLYYRMTEQGIDIFNIKRQLEMSNLEPPADNFLKVTDFSVDINVVLDGMGTLREAYY